MWSGWQRGQIAAGRPRAKSDKTIGRDIKRGWGKIGPTNGKAVFKHCRGVNGKCAIIAAAQQNFPKPCRPAKPCLGLTIARNCTHANTQLPKQRMRGLGKRRLKFFRLGAELPRKYAADLCCIWPAFAPYFGAIFHGFLAKDAAPPKCCPTRQRVAWLDAGIGLSQLSKDWDADYLHIVAARQFVWL